MELAVAWPLQGGAAQGGLCPGGWEGALRTDAPTLAWIASPVGTRRDDMQK